jgi:hypothetical protein
MAFVHTNLVNDANNAIWRSLLAVVAFLVHDKMIMNSAAGWEKEVGGINFAGIVR